MLYLSLIIIIATPLLAQGSGANPEEEVNNNNNNKLLKNRYLKQYNRAFYDNPNEKLSLKDLIDLLEDMNLIEQDKSFNLADSNDELSILRAYRFQHLLKMHNKLNVFTKRDKTMTKLLLRTFNYDANDCTKEYYAELNNIYANIVQTQTIDALNESRELQYKNCWQRLMNLTLVANFTIGSDVRSLLESINDLVNANTNQMINSSSILYPYDHENHQQESRRISQIIRNLLIKEGDSKDLIKEFKISIEYPCRLLVDRMKNIMIDVFDLIGSSYFDKNHITNEDAKMINTYITCHRLITDSDFICFNINQQNVVVSNANERERFDLNQPIEYNENVLITQYNPVNANQGLNVDANQQPTNTEDLFEVDNLPQLIIPNTFNQILQAPMENNKRVIRVLTNTGRGKNSSYRTLWSDGSISVEKKDHLIAKWPRAWKRYYRKRKNRYNMRYNARKSCKPTPTLDYDDEDEDNLFQLDDDNYNSDNENCQDQLSPTERKICHMLPMVGPLKVVLIGRPKGRARHITYPTYWSDGTKTMEKKEYLQTHWNEPWMVLVRRMRYTRQIKWLNKKNKNNQQE